MSANNQPIIAGAGPVGLAAALFLAHEGHMPRLIESKAAPAPFSKALAVNPRSLEVFEPLGLTEQILELGSMITGVHFYQRAKLVSSLSFAQIHPKYPFMVSLSQTSTERLLTKSLQAKGGAIERGLKLVECQDLPDGVEVTLEPAAGGPREVARCPWLLAADGAHSAARERLGVKFAGYAFTKQWHLADTPLHTDLATDHSHVFFSDGGEFVFMTRVVDAALQTAAPVWRVLSNRPEPLSRMKHAVQAGPPVWTSSFFVAHRTARTLAKGRIYFAGDAAHIHSPVGARGMNLGLEDAWVFAQLVRTGKLPIYDRLRRPVSKWVVRRVELFSRIARGESFIERFIQWFLLPQVVRIPFFNARLAAGFTGLDHELHPRPAA